ncbi:MAG: AMP-binding protein [Rhizobiaceae bacterium]
MYLNRQIKHHAKQAPGSIAINFGTETISFVKLCTRADHAAAILQNEYAVQAGDRVTYLGLNHPDMLVILLACEQLGAIFNPLNSRLAKAEYEYLLSDAEPKVLFADPAFWHMAQELAGTGLQLASLDRLHDTIQRPLAMAEARADEDDALLLVYTSGTTGRPKGVVLSRRAVEANIANCHDLYGFEPGQKVQITLPLFHVGGLCILLLPALTHGAAIHLHQKFDPVAALDEIAQHKITTTIFVPAQMAAMMEMSRWETSDLSSMDYVVVGSSIIPLAQIQKFHAKGIPVSQLYGATETGPGAIGLEIGNTRDKEGSAGTALANCEIEVRGPDRNPLPTGEHGDIWVRGDNILTHYWQNEAETQMVLVDGWYNTGDIGFIDPDDHYWIIDRSKDVIISGGENIYPAEIEAASLEHPAIAAIAVVGRQDPKWGETPVAAVELEEGHSLDLQTFQSFLTDRLARFKHPKDLLVVEQLPRNGMGKIEKSVLRQQVNS